MIRDQEPIFRLVHFYFGANRRDRLVWGVHHLAVDAVFRCILLEDLFSAYQQLRLHWTSQWLKLEPNAAIVDDQVCIFGVRQGTSAERTSFEQRVHLSEQAVRALTANFSASYTPADFSEAELTQKHPDAILVEIEDL